MKFKLLKLLSLFIILSLTAGCAANQPAAESDDREAMQTQRRIIIDTDTGGDDALAIMLAIEAPNITVEGITVLNGNVSLDQAADNALMCVELSGQTDIPVYKGSETTYDGTQRECFSVYGTDGMGDAGLIHPTLQVQETNAIDFILNTVKENPGEIDIVCLGPATNLALAFDRDAETMSKVRAVYIMGTTGFGVGNATPVAEFNIYHDAAAFQRLLDAEIEINVIGLDLCGDSNVVFSDELIREWENAGAEHEFLATSWNKLFEFYQGNGLDYVSICDPVAMYTLIYDDAVEESVQCSGVCITDSASPAYGQVVFYKEGFSYDSMPQIENYPISVVTEINNEVYHQRISSLLDCED